jgi:hypothetical protein
VVACIYLTQGVLYLPTVPRRECRAQTEGVLEAGQLATVERVHKATRSLLRTPVAEHGPTGE